MKKLVLSLLVIWTSEVNGQGYVVTTRNDTLRGEVKIMSFDEIDKVQVGEGKKKTQFKAIEVTVVSVGKDIYNPVLTQLGYRLLKLDHPGFLVSLYLARQAPSTTYDVQYLVKRTGKAFEVPNLKFRKQVSGFLSECASIEQKIEENKLGKNNLNEIIDEYNRCIENQTKAVFTTSSDPRLMAIAELRNKLHQNQSLASQKDLQDVLNDIYEKVSSNKKVPNYLKDVLHSLFKEAPEYNADIEKLLELLKSQ